MQPSSSTPPIALGSATIRRWRAKDRESLVRNANNRRVWINLRDTFPHPYTTADAEAWLERAGGPSIPTHFAIEIDGHAVGGVGFDLQDDVFRRSAEVGYWLGEPYWGRGVMTGAVRALTRYALADFPLDRLFAGVFASNPASARVLEKAGYALESRMRASVYKDGQVLDQLMYVRLRDDRA